MNKRIKRNKLQKYNVTSYNGKSNTSRNFFKQFHFSNKNLCKNKKKKNYRDFLDKNVLLAIPNIPLACLFVDQYRIKRKSDLPF